MRLSVWDRVGDKAGIVTTPDVGPRSGRRRGVRHAVEGDGDTEAQALRIETDTRRPGETALAAIAEIQHPLVATRQQPALKLVAKTQPYILAKLVAEFRTEREVTKTATALAKRRGTQMVVISIVDTCAG